VIINPAAGRHVALLHILNDVLSGHVDWDVSVTHERGDGSVYARSAIDEHADAVAVFGGGAMISEVASALVGSEVPMAILPGGTGNGFARSLRVPLDLHKAAALLAGEYALRTIDLGLVNGRTFVQEAELGFLADVNQATSRASKDRLGKLAYGLSSLRLRSRLRTPIEFRFSVDGKHFQSEAIMVRIINSGSAIFGQKAIFPDSSPDDGQLDLLVVAPEKTPLLKVARSVLFGYHGPTLHWRFRRAVIRADPEQLIDLDGKPLERTPAVVEAQPHAVRVVVPTSDAIVERRAVNDR